LAFSAQDLLQDWGDLTRIRQQLRGKGFKGAVGTGASYAELIGKSNLESFEARLGEKLNLSFFPVTIQTYPRKQDYRVLAGLAGLGATLYKFAFDLRLLQSPISGEISEPFASKQVGSSAMPFKRNPIQAEKIDSLARSLAQFPRVAWDNAAHALLERTLDDSANRRSILPEAFLIADELIETTDRILKGIQVDKIAVLRNLEFYSPFMGTERVLVAAVKAGADRQRVHELLLVYSRAAREAVSQGLENPLAGLVADDPYLQTYLSREVINTLFSVEAYIGDAPERARKLAGLIRREVS
jgi:adenylosuccinate lyase